MSLKRLAGQTAWYGLSNIAARLLTSLLTPYLTYRLSSPEGQVQFGLQSLFYIWLPVFNVLYTYGMETAYFRFSSTVANEVRLYRTQLTAMLLSTALFSLPLILFATPLAAYMGVPAHPEYIGWCAAIIALDALTAIPFARLRRANKPRQYAGIKVAGILAYVGLIVALFSLLHPWALRNPGAPGAAFLLRHWGTGYILGANVVQAAVSAVLLAGQLRLWRPVIDRRLLGPVLRYGGPILITGFAGVVNDTLNREMFRALYPASGEETTRLVGIYTATLRIAVLLNLAIQTFRMAAEPFFFSVAKEKNARTTYARVMKWFVIVLATMFLSIALFPDVWQYYVDTPYRGALDLLPVLLLAYVALGIYYNLTVWYKLSDKTRYGAYTTVIGAAVTVGINWLLIPRFGYAACAWGMLLSYGTMVVVCYAWGQKYYPIPYNVRKLTAYLTVAVVLWAASRGIAALTDWVVVRLTAGAVLAGLFAALVYRVEKKELRSFPVIGRFVR